MAKAAKPGAKKAAGKKGLTKSQFVAHLAEKTELSKKQVDAVLSEIVATVTDQLKSNGKFVFPNLARMTLTRVKERPGGEVKKNPVKEIGWNPVQVVDSPAARDWFGEGLREFDTFQWHGDTFSIPPGGERILAGPHCPNQAYVVGGRHLGLQCHVEMTPEMIESWIASGSGEVKDNLASPAVQPVEQIRSQAPKRLPGLSG